MPNLLVEIGTEELPQDSLDIVYNTLEEIASRILGAYRLSFDSLRVEATPRRIVLFAGGLASRQKEELLEIKGPSVDKAYDANGKPTPALEGFLRSRQAKAEELERMSLPKGEIVVLKRRDAGRPAAAVLPQALQEIFASLAFPKLMRWEASGFRFPRPVRWVIALLDAKVIPFQLGDVKASNKSRGHRFLSPGEFIVKQADWKLYESALKKAHVVLALSEREERIRKALSTEFKQKDFDEELVRTTAQLVEEPFFLEGSFKKECLALPPEVLSTCMKKNQKIFACADAKGKLVNRFVAVMNGRRAGLDRIRFDYENVLESRLKDARYFYEADMKTSLAERVPQLEQIMYLGKLGSMKDKLQRLEGLAEAVCRMAGKKELEEGLKRAAYLSKADLMTQMVFEFPNLQGIAGRYYAKAAGERDEVASAVGTQYLPKNLAQDFQSLREEMNETGALFGLIDRLDLLVGAFATGLEPTGSQDPYALRRAGGSFVKLVRAFGFHFSLSEAVKASAGFYAAGGLGSAFQEVQVVLGRLTSFFKDRVIFELQLKPGTRAMEIFEAVWRSDADDLAGVFNRYEVLKGFSEREPEAFLKAGKVVERTSNIIRQAGAAGSEVNPALFQETPERQLFEVLEKNSSRIAEKLGQGAYEEATRLFGQVFYEPVDAFFATVMVNAEDAAVRQNRQALMRRINCLYTEKIADLSALSRLEKE